MSDQISHGASVPSVPAPTTDKPTGGDGSVRVVFPDGKFYACSDPESLTHTDPLEAIEEYLDADLDPRMTVAEVVKCIRARPITVRAYEPSTISDKQIACWADNLLDRLAEDFSEEHSDPDGETGDGLPKDAGAILLAAVQNIISRAHVWTCEEVGKVTLSPDEIEAVMREHRPDWFRDPVPSQTASATSTATVPHGDESPAKSDPTEETRDAD